MHLNASDFGFRPSGDLLDRCAACNKSGDWYCCDGNGNRLTFGHWAKGVDKGICLVLETETNDIEAPYAEMYMEGLTVPQAVKRALDQ